MDNAVAPQTPSQTAPSRFAPLWSLRAVRIMAAGALATAAVLVLSTVRHFALTRFFTVDEYQWGHATWLVSVGQVPYRDFYEHHLPLGYILHSWLLPNDASFIERALMLRHIAFAYVLLGCASVAVAEYVATRNVFAAISFVIVPISVGFGLMSAIDYRGDNWSAFVLVCCFSVLRANQLVRRRWLAALAGVLSALALLMTQKTVFLGGVGLFVMFAVSLAQRRSSRWGRWHAWLSSLEIHHPGTFAIAAAVPLIVALGVGARAGVLRQAFEITVEQAWQHEQLYPGFSAWKYLEPYLAYAPLSTATLVACALGYAALSTEHFWVLPTAAALLGGLSPKAPFPYNLVLASFLVGVCAVRGYTEALRYVAGRWPRLNRVTALGYLVPLLIIPTQIGFVRRTTTNESQLETLRLIEAHTTPEDIVIDNEGGALFRPHRSYYWYHGMAHVQMFRDYYEHAFIEDLRATRAIFWLNTTRTRQLPVGPRHYLQSHYVRVHGDLYVLGFALSPSLPDHLGQQTLDVVRAGDYFLACASAAADPPAASPATLSGAVSRWRIDGRPINDGSVHLDPGLHRVEGGAETPGCRLTYLPAAEFDDEHVGRHAPLFEYTSAW